MKRLLFLVLLLLAPAFAWAEVLYVTQAGAGGRTGANLANAFSASDFNTPGNWGAGAGKISAADIVVLTPPFTTLLAPQGSGTSEAARTILYFGGSWSSPFTNTSTFTSAGLSRGVDGNGKNYIAVIGMHAGQGASGFDHCILFSAASVGWLIEDNFFDTTWSGSGITRSPSSTVCSNMTIRHNGFKDIGLGSGGTGEPVVIGFQGNNNLVEHNWYSGGLDRHRPNGTKYVLRLNYDFGTNPASYPNTGTYPYHVDFAQIFDETGITNNQVLLDRNWCQDLKGAGTGESQRANQHFFLSQISVTGSQEVVRGNVVARISDGFMLTNNWSDVAVYNNTATDTQTEVTTIQLPLVYFEAGTGLVNMCIVNTGWINATVASPTFTNNPFDAATPTPRFVDYDAFFNAGTINHGTHNVGGGGAGASTNPLFNAGTDVYTLQSGSPWRAAGTPVATANGAAGGGSSTALTLNAASATTVGAKGIFDGWGITGIVGDLLKVGSNPYQRVVSVVGNVVTLTDPINWSNGDSVLVKGNEDIGAQPFNYALTYTVALVNSTLASGANSLTATINNPDAVDSVEYLVDGIPVGISYTATGNFPVSYTSDGATHVVTARAYAAWANPLLSADAIKTLSPSSAVQAVISNLVKSRIGAGGF